MKMADKFDMPIITFIDTQGPTGKARRGQAEAIARNLKEMIGINVPICLLQLERVVLGRIRYCGQSIFAEYAVYSVVPLKVVRQFYLEMPRV